MKTLVVPTDFSSAALNAVNYAADMALEINAAVLLLHIYQVPVAITDSPMIMVSIEELKEAAETRLSKLKEDLTHITSGKLVITTEVVLGDITDETESICEKIKPLAVITGTTGHTAAERTLFGSTTLSLIKNLSSPVICVPTGKEYGTGIKKAGLACDFKDTDNLPLPAIRSFIQTMGAALHIINVDHKHSAHAETSLLRTALEELKPSYHFVEHPDVEDGLNEFAEKNNLDLLITMPRKHKLLESLFKRSTTKQLVFESHIPVMCIHN